jgi:glycosyltransferase involved in cell wall biosynthesis
LAINVLHAFSTFDLGGPQARTVDLIHSLGNGFHHHITAMDQKFGAAERLKTSNFSLHPISFKKSGVLANRQVIRQICRNVNASTVVSYNWGAIEWVLFAPSALNRLHVEEGFSIDEASSQFYRRKLFRKLAFRLKTPKVVTVSKSISRIAQESWGIDDRKLHLVENGVDLARYNTAGNLPIDARLEDGNFRFGTVAGLRPEKRLDRLIEAFSKANMPRATLEIAGSGPLEPLIRAKVSELGLTDRVVLLGHVSDTAKFLSSLNCFVLASETEQAPISLMEAMATGLPCIVTKAGDMPLMLPSAQGNFVVDKSSDDICVALDSAYRMRDMTKAASINRSYAESHFDALNMTATWRELLRGELIV